MSLLALSRWQFAITDADAQRIRGPRRPVRAGQLGVIFSPSFICRWPHMLNAVLISASFFVAGVGAWYLVSQPQSRDEDEVEQAQGHG